MKQKRLCAHADAGGEGMHWLEPGEHCTQQRGGTVHGDEYHAVDLDEESSSYMTCRFCSQPWGDHESSCPMAEPDDYDDPYLRGREEDRAYGDLRERYEWP